MKLFTDIRTLTASVRYRVKTQNEEALLTKQVATNKLNEVLLALQRFQLFIMKGNEASLKFTWDNKRSFDVMSSSVNI